MEKELREIVERRLKTTLEIILLQLEEAAKALHPLKEEWLKDCTPE
jgi:hypothetical protein